MDPTKKRIRHVKRLAEAAVPLKHHWETARPWPRQEAAAEAQGAKWQPQPVSGQPHCARSARYPGTDEGWKICVRAPGRHCRRHHHRRPQPGQPAAEASDCNASGSAAVSRRRSWLPAPPGLRLAQMPTPAREARDDLPLAHAVWRRPSGCRGSSPASELSPRDHLFSTLPCSAWEQASHSRGGSQPPRARGMAAHAEAAPRAGALLRQLAAVVPGSGSERGGRSRP